jgi:hypothetical protein
MLKVFDEIVEQYFNVFWKLVNFLEINLMNMKYPKTFFKNEINVFHCLKDFKIYFK